MELEKVEGKVGCCQKLSVCALGFGLGVSWLVGVILLTLLSMRFGVGENMMHAFASVYVGMAATPLGIIVGCIWAFIDGFVAGVIIAWVYNFVVKRHHCKICCGKSHEGK